MKKAKKHSVEYLHKRIDRLGKRLECLENKYYSWQNYFKKKKKRFDVRYQYRDQFAKDLLRMRELLKKLSIKQVIGYNRKDKRRHIVVMAHNDVVKLQRFIRKRQYLGRKTSKKDGQLVNFTRNEKRKLRGLLMRDWRKRKTIKFR